MEGFMPAIAVENAFAGAMEAPNKVFRRLSSRAQTLRRRYSVLSSLVQLRCLATLRRARSDLPSLGAKLEQARDELAQRAALGDWRLVEGLGRRVQQLVGQAMRKRLNDGARIVAAGEHPQRAIQLGLAGRLGTVAECTDG